jgi:hypothetical protein
VLDDNDVAKVSKRSSDTFSIRQAHIASAGVKNSEEKQNHSYFLGQELCKQGYFQLNSAETSLPIGISERLALGVKVLMAHGYPANAILMYDEAWLVGDLITSLLEPATGNQPVGDWYIFCVDPTKTDPSINSLQQPSESVVSQNGAASNRRKVRPFKAQESCQKKGYLPGPPHRDRPVADVTSFRCASSESNAITSPDKNATRTTGSTGVALTAMEVMRHPLDFAPKYCSVWLALTEASAENSCLYCIPSHKDHGYFAQGDAKQVQVEPVAVTPLAGLPVELPVVVVSMPASAATVVEALVSTTTIALPMLPAMQVLPVAVSVVPLPAPLLPAVEHDWRDITALPLHVGSLLTFSHRLLHWGSNPQPIYSVSDSMRACVKQQQQRKLEDTAANATVSPLAPVEDGFIGSTISAGKYTFKVNQMKAAPVRERIALTLAFADPSFEAPYFDHSLYGPYPPLGLRLGLIAGQMIQYEHLAPLDKHHLGLYRRIFHSQKRYFLEKYFEKNSSTCQFLAFQMKQRRNRSVR